MAWNSNKRCDSPYVDEKLSNYFGLVKNFLQIDDCFVADQFKSVVLSPLTGIFDARSSADQQLENSFAWKENLQVSTDGKLQTASGFARIYAVNTIVQTNGVPCPYKNADFHNQGISIAQKDLEVPTLLFPSTDNAGGRNLYMGTKSKFLRLEEVAGDWTVIGSGFGADGVDSKTSLRWEAAQLQNNIYLTNVFDPVQYHTIGTNVMQEVTGLQTAGESGPDAVAVTKPVVIIKYAAVIMIMNMEENNSRIASRIRWSDLNDGTYWGTGTVNPNTQATSISDFQDLDYGERILAAIELFGYLYVFTDSSIWRCSFTVDTQSSPPAANLICNKIYTEPKNKSRCIWYPKTLVSDGDSMYYAAKDAIYKFNPYMLDPERTEWIFRSTSIVFDDGIGGIPIDSTSCNSPIMEYWPDQKEIHFSWPVPDAKFVGTPSCDPVPPVLSSGISRHTLVINVQWETCDYRDYGTTALANFQSNLVADGQCAKPAMFFGACGQDLCIKQFGIGFAREMYDYVAATYSAVGYSPILVGEFPFGTFDAEKEIKLFLLDGYVGTDVGNVFTLSIGTSYQQMPINGAINSATNVGQCGVLWHRMKNRVAKCLMTMTPEQYVARKVRPSYDHRWNFLWRGRFLYYWLSMEKASGGAPVDGGVTFTRFQVDAVRA